MKNLSLAFMLLITCAAPVGPASADSDDDRQGYWHRRHSDRSGGWHHGRRWGWGWGWGWGSDHTDDQTDDTAQVEDQPAIDESNEAYPGTDD